MENNNSSSSQNFKFLCELIRSYLNSYIKISEYLSDQNDFNSINKQNYYVVDFNWLSELKNFIGFNEVISELKRRKLQYISDDDFVWIIPLIEKAMKDNKNETYVNTLFPIANSILVPMELSKDLELIDSSCYEMIKNILGGVFKKEVEIKCGNLNIIIKLNDKNFLIKYKNDKNSTSYEEILLIFEEGENEINEEDIYDYIDNISHSRISEWINNIKNDKNTQIITENDSKFEYIIKCISYSIRIKKRGTFDLISLEVEEEVLTFPKKIVKKIEKSSYIIATMQSLSQIIPFSNYFLNGKFYSLLNKMMSSTEDGVYHGIAKDFKDYIYNLWKSEETFTPKDFMKKIRKISENNEIKFSLKEEVDPTIFYNYIMNELNIELKGYDPRIHNNYLKKLERINTSSQLKTNFKKNYSIYSDKPSIVSTLFFSYIEIATFCKNCKKEEKSVNQYISSIPIEIDKFILDQKSKGNSVTKIYFDDYLEYYFGCIDTKPDVCGLEKSSKKTQKYTIRRLLELPSFLVITIKWGDFKNEKGFKCKNDNIKPLYKHIENYEIIEIKKEFFNDEYAYNEDNKIEGPIKYKLLSVVDYFQEKNIFLSKYKIKEEGKKDKWYVSWCNSIGKEKENFIDDFSTPCILFYEKI